MSKLRNDRKLAIEELTKQAIYDATVEVITEKGFERLTMQDIANKAQIATGTLYNYFRNKEDLLVYVDQMLHDFVMRYADELFEVELEPTAKLKNFSQNMFDECIKYRIVFDTIERIIDLDEAMLDEHENNYKHIIKLIREIIEEGIQAGVFRNVNAEIVSRMYFMSMLGIFESTGCCSEQYIFKLKESLHTFFDEYLLMQ